MENGVLIPKTLQKGILELLHTGHPCQDKTIPQARYVYWYKLNGDIDKMYKQYSICQEFQWSQQEESLHQHEVPTKPWDSLEIDLFSLDGDQLSCHCWLLQWVCNCVTSSKTLFKCQSCWHLCLITIPTTTVLNTNNLHLKWSFQHVTSSLHYPRSSGFAEQQIQMIKNTIKRDSEGVELALLFVRTVPIDLKLPNPAEFLFNSRVKNIYCLCTPAKRPRVKMISSIIWMRGRLHKKFSSDLPPLNKGQHILIQDQNSKRWKPGQIQDLCWT